MEADSMAPALKPLTAEAIALTEKKMNMSLDDIIKMSEVAAPKDKKQQKRRGSYKSRQGFSKGNSAQDKPTRLRRFMDNTRSDLRQSVLAQRRSNFPVAKNESKVTPLSWNKSRGGNYAQDKETKVGRYMDTRSTLRQGVLAQRRSHFPVPKEAARWAAGGAPLRNRGYNQNQWKPRAGSPFQRRRYEEQRMRTQPPRWNDAVEQRNRGQERRPWGTRGRRFGN